MMSKNVYQYGQGDNFAGDYVAGDKNEYNVSASQDLVTAAKEIRLLLGELESDYDTSTPVGVAGLTVKAIEDLEARPTLKARVVNALKEGGTTAFEEAVDHPAVKPMVAMLRGFIDA